MKYYSNFDFQLWVFEFLIVNFLKVNTLTQLENLKRYKFIKGLLDQNKIHAYALWFDIYCGDVYCFSFREKRFIKLDDESYERLISNLYDRLKPHKNASMNFFH